MLGPPLPPAGLRAALRASGLGVICPQVSTRQTEPELVWKDAGGAGGSRGKDPRARETAGVAGWSGADGDRDSADGHRRGGPG